MPETTTPPNPTRVRDELLAGARANLPFMPGAAAFGLLAGAVTVNAGWTEFESIVLSVVMYAGNAQIVAMQLLGTGAPALIAVGAVAVVNLRHVMYGLSLGPYLKHAPVWLKMLCGFVLVDNTYALSHQRYRQPGAPEDVPRRTAFLLGTALVGYPMWCAACVIGVLVGARLPADWQLDLIPSLGLIAIIVPNLKDRPTVAAAVISAVLATLLNNVPLRLGVLMAGGAAMIVGVWLDGRKARAEAARRS